MTTVQRPESDFWEVMGMQDDFISIHEIISKTGMCRSRIKKLLEVHGQKFDSKILKRRFELTCRVFMIRKSDA